MLTAGRIENFKEYSKFCSIKKFNNTIEMFLVDHKKNFTKGELIAFKRLVRFSAKYYGVANAKIGTLLKAINGKMNNFGISRSTFERMLRKAKELGILTVENTIRHKGGQGHNVYVFNTIDAPTINKMTDRENLDKSCESKGERAEFEEETSIPLETSNIKNINKRNNARLDSTFTASYVPKEFVQAVKPFYDHAATIEDFWKSVFLDTRKISDIVDAEIITYTAIDAFKQSIRSYKRGNIRTNFVRYFTGTFKKIMDKVYFDLPLHL